MYSSVIFNMFTILFSDHHYLIPEYWHHPQKKPLTPGQWLLVLPTQPSAMPFVPSHQAAGSLRAGIVPVPLASINPSDQAGEGSKIATARNPSLLFITDS